MSRRLVEAGSRLLESRTSRRGFLRRAALVGTALAAAPTTYILRPGDAYSAVLSSGTECRDNGGWTEFCCTMTGVNTCPPGSVVGGWWRAERVAGEPDHCDGNSRYYMDCHSADCGSCGCGGSGTCGTECVDCSCGCANGDTSNWKTCCTRFRYGQCNQHIECVGPIVCRVVTCVPPWEWDSSCMPTDARDDRTYHHDAACLRPSPVYPARPAVVSGTTWKLRNSLTSGGPNQRYPYGQPGDFHLMADWTGSGVKTAGVVRGVRHGPAGDADLTWYIRQVEGTGAPDLVFRFGQAGDIPVVGDWDGDGVATVGVVRGNRWLLRNSNSAGPPDLDFRFGDPGDLPVVGRWVDDGIARAGMVRGDTWRVRQPDGSARSFEFDGSGVPITGDWNGNGIDGPGWFDAGTWRIRNTASGGSPDATFEFGSSGDVPLVWGKLT